METQNHIKAQNLLMLGLQFVLLLAGTGASVDSSSVSGEVDRFNSSFKHKSKLDIISLPFSQNFLMKSYFEKYETLSDSDFQEFIAHDPSHGSCKAFPDGLDAFRQNVLQRNLIGDGSHRYLLTSFKYNFKLKEISKLPKHVCEAIIIERLPSGVFADPFELQHLVQRGVFKDAAVFGDTNLELPSALSSRSAVEIHMDLDPNFILRNDGLEFKIELPLHARYPPLDESSGYSKVHIGEPDLFLHCSIEGTMQHQNCLWMLTDQGAESKAGAVVWKIPSGIKAHAKVVSVVTYLSAILSAVSIVLACIYYSDFNNKNLKQS